MQFFSPEYLLDLFKLAERIDADLGKPKPFFADAMKGMQLASLFYEASTRTRWSFETATNRLGGTYINFGEKEGTSIQKGETLGDTIKMASGYSDIIVLRHSADGAARHASKFSDVPVINGGDGQHQHPTQTMLDLYTIQKEWGRLDNLHIAIVGDLKYGRTTHSLLYGAAMFGNEISLVSPEILKMPEKYKEYAAKKYNAKMSEFISIEDVIEDADVLYMTRIQRERFPKEAEDEYKKVAEVFRLGGKLMQKAKDRMIVMHPLPRKGVEGRPEITFEVDLDSRAKYFGQAANGIPVRMALICDLLGLLEVEK